MTKSVNYYYWSITTTVLSVVLQFIMQIWYYFIIKTWVKVQQYIFKKTAAIFVGDVAYFSFLQERQNFPSVPELISCLPL